MHAPHCLIEREGHVLIVTLNRPKTKNHWLIGALTLDVRGIGRLNENIDLFVRPTSVDDAPVRRDRDRGAGHVARRWS
jgi:hypothetical protein